MRALRQMGGGLIIAVLSLLLVIGGISLSLSETNSPEQPTPTPLPPIIATSIELPTLTPIPVNTVESVATTATITFTAIPSTTQLAPVTVCIPPIGWIQIVVTANDTLYTIAERYKTTTELLNSNNCLNNTIPAVNSLLYVPPVPTVTVIPCGPPGGWVKTHVVQPGDNLFRIALSYGITYPQLQRANCMGSSTTIFAGQLLWVPNIPTRTPGITIVPNFPTATPSLTPSASATLMPADSPTVTLTTTPTNTSEPTGTFTPSFTPATPP